MSFNSLNCERCSHSWNYKGNALENPNKRVHCPKCNSTKILNVEGNKVNLGFKHIPTKTPTNEIPTNESVGEKIPQQTETPTLDLSHAKNMLSQQIPSLEQTQKNIQQKTQTQTLQPTTNLVTPPKPADLFGDNDFKIVYSLLDDIVVSITKNKGIEHTESRKKEMSALLSKMLNKYGLQGSIEIIFIVSNIAYLSPLFYFLYKKKTKPTEKEDKPTPTKPEDKPEIPEDKGKTVSPTTKIKTKNKKVKTEIFSKGETKTVNDYIKETGFN